MKICLATNNPHKVREMRNIIPDSIELLTLDEIGCNEELEETQDTIEGNSMQKADYVFNTYRIACIADDTGLEVNALNGDPGVYSARYAGDHKNNEDNIDLLLKNLEGKDRTAQFKTVITLITDQETQQFEGLATGEIIHERKGANGFGYDPVFKPHGYSQTFAELSEEEKNRISHRGIAIKKLLIHIRENYG
jgi:XTP/dITP diphosphohydrolase